MKQLFLTLLLISAFAASAQRDTAAPPVPVKHASFERYSTIATISAGFIDPDRQSYSLPQGYEKSNTSGFASLYGKLEYGVSRQVSLAATVSYDAFVYNFNQVYTGNTGTFTRYRADNLRAASGGLTAYWHLGHFLHIRSLDPFIGAGVSLNNIRYSAYPQGDTSVVKLSHPVTASLRVGARYYVSPHCSFFGDAGYDKQSIFSLGISCRFFKTRKTIVREADSDGDGVPDKVDSCPYVKGLAQFSGCPDTDGDGIPDNRDACPTEPGPADNHGCPTAAATGAAIIQPKTVVIPKNVIRFLPSTATLTDSSLAILDSMAGAMKGSGKTDISIAPYTGTDGAQPVSKKTANARAVAIKKYFTDKGFPATRLIFTKAGAEPKAKKRREIIALRYDTTY